MSAVPTASVAAPVLVRLCGLSKRFGSVEAVRPLDLKIHAGDFFAILGPSECGKTTLLRMIGGFIAPSTGVVEIGGADVTRLGPERRPANMVFQGFGLFLHMNVRQNAGAHRRENTCQLRTEAGAGTRQHRPLLLCTPGHARCKDGRIGEANALNVPVRNERRLAAAALCAARRRGNCAEQRERAATRCALAPQRMLSHRARCPISRASVPGSPDSARNGRPYGSPCRAW